MKIKNNINITYNSSPKEQKENKTDFFKEQEKMYGGVPDFTENDKFIEMVQKNPPETFTFSVVECWGRPQIIFMDAVTGERVCDAVCHHGSYGHESGLIETMGRPLCGAIDDDVEGYLTAETVYARLMNADKERISEYKSEN